MLAKILIAIVAVIHIYILVLEMFLWDTNTGRKAFKLSAEFSRDTRVMAANQGLYNGFLAAGLIWGLWLGAGGTHITLYFLVCVLIAGIYGGITASKKILYVQALPAFLALLTLIGQ